MLLISGGTLIELADHILTESRSLLTQGRLKLPMQLPSSPVFYLAEAEDESVMAFGAISHEGVTYKIGVKKTSE